MTLQLAAHTSHIIPFMPSIISTCWRAWQLLGLLLLSQGAVAGTGSQGGGTALQSPGQGSTWPRTSGILGQTWPRIKLNPSFVFSSFSTHFERSLRLLLSVAGWKWFSQLFSWPYKIILTWVPTTKPLKATAAELHSASSCLLRSSCISMSSKKKTTQGKTWLCHFSPEEPLAHIPLPNMLQVRCGHN